MMAQVLGCILISVPDTSYLLWAYPPSWAAAASTSPALTAMVTQLFEPDDKRRESAFLWNYSGMNIGFFIGFAMGGYFI